VALLREARPGAGRGATARVEIAGAGGVILKKMRRGGLLAGLWRERFLGARRLVANLAIPVEAIRRGVRTPAPVALLVTGGGALLEAWLAVEEVAGGRDLPALLRRGVPPEGALASAMAAVRRMHDAGLHHRDLNLGNVLVRERPPGRWEGFVLDLDRAVLRSGPVPSRLRALSLLRLERSYVKLFGSRGPLGEAGRDAWYELYAGGDPLRPPPGRAARRLGRLAIALHRLGWRR
jgi:hypothetical protein